MRAPEPRQVVAAAAVLAMVAGGGCAAGGDPIVPSVGPTPTASGPSAVASIPADGVSLQSLGYVNGPVQEFSLPRTALVRATVDQANNVTAVLAQPPPADVAAYLRRALPATGFTVTAEDDAGLALTFVGHGWTGSFTAGAATSAILLRPA